MGCWATNYLILGCPFATSATREAPIALGGICSLLLQVVSCDSFMILSTLVFHGIELRYLPIDASTSVFSNFALQSAIGLDF